MRKILAKLLEAMAQPPCDPDGICWIEIVHPYMLPW